MQLFARFCLFFLCINVPFANAINGTLPAFDVKQANQKFDRINLQLSVQNLNLNNLETAVNTLNLLTTKADDCVEDIQRKISNTEMLIKQTSNTVESSKNEGADLVYLNNQQKELSDEQAQCRLFSIRAKEAIEAYKDAIAKIKQEEALTRSMPLWKMINQALESPPETKLINLLTTEIPASLPPLFSSILLACMALIASTFTLLKLQRSRSVRHYFRIKKLYVSYIVLLSSFFISGALFTSLLIFSQDLSKSDLPLVLSGLFFFYLTSLMVILLSFKMNKIRALFYWYSLDERFFQNVSVTLLSFYTTALVGRLISNSFSNNSPLWQSCQSLFILVTLTTSAYFIHYFCKVHRHFSFIKHYNKLIQRFSFMLLTTCAIINVLGYLPLAQHLTFSGLTSFIVIFNTLLITQGINKIYLMMSQQETTRAKIIKYFGYRKDQIFSEFLILKTVAQLITVATSVYFVGRIWGFATDFIESIYEQLLDGVHIVNITIYPTRILSGTVVFCSLYLLFRAISTSISRHQQFEDEEETQVAVASILNYVGFSIALISGFLIAGFDFTGLAIIAGALSVGIGLGLQSIVNNFVSGLILLIEKPIRPGDRINVDGIEGFVKKIRVRSTQIITSAREDIIVPNSDLITRRVTNYMFSDHFFRINCEIRVAYGSDTHLVRDTLLNLAHNHDEVIKNGRNKPVVLFRSFSENNLVFQLVCLIKDVNKKSLVQSELNFAIEKAFRENNIEIPSHQREVNIKVTEMLRATTKPYEFHPTES